jgi:hypothetical protein
VIAEKPLSLWETPALRRGFFFGRMSATGR